MVVEGRYQMEEEGHRIQVAVGRIVVGVELVMLVEHKRNIVVAEAVLVDCPQQGTVRLESIQKHYRDH